ncbi:hypothetical protein [Leptospira sp. 'Mane']|uniref:hypothetical protein n=1 Tax=Leptospira sp. 'Mane' TaxID=3387407 RepID=UPI00398AE43B
MKNSKFNKEIDKRLNDPTWEKRILTKVLESESNSVEAFIPANRQVATVYLKLVAAAFLVAFGIGFWFYGNHSDSNRNSVVAKQKNPLSTYDIESGDLLWEEEDYDSSLLGLLEDR